MLCYTRLCRLYVLYNSNCVSVKISYRFVSCKIKYNLFKYYIFSSLVIFYTSNKESRLKQVKPNKVTVEDPKKPFLRKIIFPTRIFFMAHSQMNEHVLMNI